MMEFFRGWRRKVGVCTLVMACLFAGGWNRALSHRDKLIFNGQSVYVVLWFNNQLISSTPGITAGLYFSDGLAQPKGAMLDWSSHPILTPDQVEENLKRKAEFRNLSVWDEEANWERKLFGFVLFGAENRILLFAPYWSVVISLTALSAFLLLSQPLPSTSKKTAQPIPDKGGGAAT